MEKDAGLSRDKTACLKDGYQSMRRHLRMLMRLSSFCEFPDSTPLTVQGFESAMNDVALSVDQLNAKYEELKGYLKAKKN